MAQQSKVNGRKTAAKDAPAPTHPPSPPAEAGDSYEMSREQHAVWQALHQEVSALALEHSRAARAAEQAADKARAAEAESVKAAGRAAELAKAVAHAESRHHQRTFSILKEMGCPVGGGATVDVDAETGRVTVTPPPPQPSPRALARTAPAG